MTLYVLTYNNYYNRIIKHDQLQTLLDSAIYQQNDVNFNPNDGVDTTIDLGTVFNPWNSKGDYLIAVDDNGDFTRWFIIEANRNNSVQYRITLRRDLIADYYNQILAAPAFIQKASLEAYDDGIFNSENMSFNQILTEQTLLKDSTQTPWVVGFIPRDAFKYDGSGQPYKKIVADIYSNVDPDYTVENISQLPFYSQIDTTVKIATGVSALTVKYSGGGGLQPGQIDSNGVLAGTVIVSTFTLSPRFTHEPLFPWQLSNKLQEYRRTLASQLWNYTSTGFNTIEHYLNASYSDYRQTNPWQDKEYKTVYQSSTGQYYKISVDKQYGIKDFQTGISVGTTLYQDVVGVIRQANNIVNADGSHGLYMNTSIQGNGNITVRPLIDKFTLRLQPLATKISIDIPWSKVPAQEQPDIQERPHLIDSPYDMFCIPYQAVRVLSGGVDFFTTQNNISISLATNIASSIALSQGSDNVYDVQLLPYCPVRQAKGAQGTINRTTNSYLIYQDRNQVAQPVSILYFCTESTFNFDIEIDKPWLTVSKDPTQLKVQSECDFVRLCSPNYQGVFEFTPAKNRGVDVINVACTYKPYTPFIYLSPDFNGLYGINPIRDSRGLLCGGDFSLPQVNSAWANYQLSNKNYQAQFDRSILNMETTHRIGQVSSAAQGAIGILGGIAGGAVSGGVGGAIAGGVSKAVQGGLNLITNQLLHNQAIDFAKDNFGMQLQNIKALPQSLSKTSAIVFNNKLWPFLEYYTCTQIQKQALRNKILYNGMTVGRIGTMSEFIKPQKSYIKCKLIRLQELQEDFHIINAIAGELDKGVFI